MAEMLLLLIYSQQACLPSWLPVSTCAPGIPPALISRVSLRPFFFLLLLRVCRRSSLTVFLQPIDGARQRRASRSLTLSFLHSSLFFKQSKKKNRNTIFFSLSSPDTSDLQELRPRLTDHVHQNDFKRNDDLIWEERRGEKRRGERREEEWRVALSEALQQGAFPVQTCCNLTSEDLP